MNPALHGSARVLDARVDVGTSRPTPRLLCCELCRLAHASSRARSAGRRAVASAMLAHASPSASVDCAARIRATCTDLDETLTTNASFNSFGYRWFARWHLCPPDQGFNCLYRERKQVAQCLASRSACASRCTVAKPRSGASVSTRFFAELASQIVGKVRQHRAGVGH